MDLCYWLSHVTNEGTLKNAIIEGLTSGFPVIHITLCFQINWNKEETIHMIIDPPEWGYHLSLKVTSDTNCTLNCCLHTTASLP